MDKNQDTGAEDVRWDLADLYAGPDDPAIDADFKAALGRGAPGEIQGPW